MTPLRSQTPATLGRTGLQATRLGLGCGGPSRLGTRNAATDPGSIDRAAALVRTAIDLGITLFDAAETYGTEPVLGRVLGDLPATDRDRLVICTKASCRDWDRFDRDRDQRPPLRTTEAFIEAIEGCCRRLRISTIDLFQVHAVTPDDLAYVDEHIYPALQDCMRRGLVRCAGLTEAFAMDPDHRMFRAVLDDPRPAPAWDVAMVGFNVLNQSARDRVLAHTKAQRLGTLAMFAVRRALSQPERLAEVIADLEQRGEIEPGAAGDPPLAWLAEAGEGTSASARLVDAAYRFCRDEPGIDVVLSGTGSPEHLEANARSMARPPLPEAITERARRVFARATSASGN